MGKTRALKHFDTRAQNLSNRTWRISSAFSAKRIRPISAIFVKTRMRLGIRCCCLLEMDDIVDRIGDFAMVRWDLHTRAATWVLALGDQAVLRDEVNTGNAARGGNLATLFTNLGSSP
jgi:hypothetical protein